MSKDLLDSEFYERKELPARDWWETRRSLFNKFCLSSIACLFLITFLIFIKSETGFTTAFIVCIIFSLMFFPFSNIAYSGIWVLEDALNKIFTFKSTQQSREILFRIIIFFTFSPAILYLIIMFI